MKKFKYLILVIIISCVLMMGITFAINNTTREYSDDNFKVSYDSTWNVENKNNELKLKHKKTGSILRIQCKSLSSAYIDVKLDDIINDTIYSIEKQNEGYNLINKSSGITDKYQSYSFLYEKDMQQVLVNIYKKDAKLIIAYYEADSEYYDIVLDSVDTILDSLEIYTGEKVN